MTYKVDSYKKITPDEFVLMARYIKDICGISLDYSKVYLIENRLNFLMKQHEFRTYSELFFKARNDRTGTLQKDIINAITTRETSFFRDRTPFELIKDKLIPELQSLRDGKFNAGIPVRIWSAGCSSGQEVYSLAITMTEAGLDKKGISIRVLGTDISDMALDQASKGAYSTLELGRGLDASLKSKYFTAIGNEWKVRPEIRSMVSFRKVNLMEDFSNLGRFDIVLCRNVAVYFNEEDRRKMFERIHGIMERNSFLIVGSTESLSSYNDLFVPHRNADAGYYSPA